MEILYLEKYGGKMRGNVENENLTCCEYTSQFFNVAEW